MPQLELDIETDVPPETVIAALTDTTEKRLEYWPGISPEFYEVVAKGDTWADIKEGTKAPGMSAWAIEHYDWSQPGIVKWTVKESNFSAPGSYVMAKVDPDGSGGSRIHVTWEREGLNFKGKLMVGLMKLLNARPVAASMKKGLKGLSQRG